MGNFGGVTLAVDATSIYAFVNGATAGSYSLRIVPKAPGSRAPSPTVNVIGYTLPQCNSLSPHIEITSDGFFTACDDNTAVPAAQVQSWLYALPRAAPNATNVAGTLLTTNKSLDKRAFAVANGSVYYDDSAGSLAQSHVYKLAMTGGSPAPIMSTQYVAAMMVMGPNLVVASGCGVQAVGL
jgi:hypothetical protein